MSIVKDYGRFGNHFFRNLAVSFIAKKHNLMVIYENKDSVHKINLLGISLFSGKNKYKDTVKLIEYDLVLKGVNSNNNYFNILNSDSFKQNIDPNHNECYCQTQYVSNLIYDYLRIEENKNQIMCFNKFMNRYNNNNDCFIHVRLTDAACVNSGFDYYDKTLSQISFDNLYLATDEIDHDIIKQIMNKYPGVNILSYDIIDLMKFASTNKYIVLSHGSFSAMIGYLSFFSEIYYPEYEHSWHGDMFSIPSWNKVSKN